MAAINLPVQLTSFIGREDDLAEVEQLLSKAHLVTLTGPGGCGKTRLAIQIANELHENFKDGIWWVDLSALLDPDLLPQLVMFTLGLKSAAEETIQTGLIKVLQINNCCSFLIIANI